MYKKRLSDKIIETRLQNNGAVLIVGAKYCGKTSSAKQFAKSIVYFDDVDETINYKKVLDIKPSLLLNGDKPRLFDEWQTAPIIWDAIRHDIDKTNGKGLYLLTGSSTPSDKEYYHSGTGRIARVLMHTMSLFESGDSTGQVSIMDLFNGKDDIATESKHPIEDIS